METAPVSPEAGPLETPFQPTSEVAPEAAGVDTSTAAPEADGTNTSEVAPEAAGVALEAPVICTPKKTDGDAPMAADTTSDPGKVEREREATDRSANAVDTHFHLDRLARAVRRKEEQGKSMSLASVLADVFRPKQPQIHAMHLLYAVPSFKAWQNELLKAQYLITNLASLVTLSLITVSYTHLTLPTRRTV